jgi:tetratricopeptide (TPR) repeat protein
MQSSAATFAVISALRPHTPALSAKEERLKRDWLLPALEHYRQARDACPLNTSAQLGIAGYAAEFTAAEPVAAYLARVKLLARDNYNFWYFCGLYEFSRGDLENACRSWQRSLSLSDVHAQAILDKLSGTLAPMEIASKVLPDNPELLMMAAKQLFPEVDMRKPLLQRALRVVTEKAAPLEIKDLHLKGRLLFALGDPDKASAAYEELLLREPQHLSWQLEFAQLLYEHGELQRARRQLYICLTLQPGNTDARQLLTVVERELALQP